MTKTKKLIIALTVVILVVTAFALLGALHEDFNLLLWSHTPTKLPTGYTITAHAGCEDTPANTIASLQKGYEIGAQIVEFDVHFTASGECVLSHNQPEAGKTQVTFDEALAYLASTTLRANIDLKSTKNLPGLYATIQKYNMVGRVFFTGISEKDVPAIQKNCPDVPYYLNVDGSLITKKQIRSAVEKAVDLGALGLNIKYTKLSKFLCNECHAKGLLVSVFTPDKMVHISHVLRYSPDNITSRRPTKVQKAISVRGVRN